MRPRSSQAKTAILANAAGRQILKGYVPGWVFFLFNVTFISFTQSILLFLIAAPAYPILLSIQFDPTLQYSDIAFCAIELGLILSEWFSDGQQWGKLPQGVVCFS